MLFKYAGTYKLPVKSKKKKHAVKLPIALGVGIAILH